jgi:hypothetical protein
MRDWPCHDARLFVPFVTWRRPISNTRHRNGGCELSAGIAAMSEASRYKRVKAMYVLAHREKAGAQSRSFCSFCSESPRRSWVSETLSETR